MIKVENIKVYNIARAVYSARNPLNSWEKSDSDLEHDILGKNDLALAKRLYKAGSEHRKYLRQIMVCMDITTNHTVWAEADTYKIGVTRNSCSKMHKIHAKEFTMDDFSCEGVKEVGGMTLVVYRDVIEALESLRRHYNETHEKKYWRAIIDMLPMGYNLRATVTMNYENVVNIIRQRSGHKMSEWNEFVDVLKDLPYIREIMEE